MSLKKNGRLLTIQGQQAAKAMIASFDSPEALFEQYGKFTDRCERLGTELPAVLAEVMEAGAPQAKIMAAVLLLNFGAISADCGGDAKLIAEAHHLIVQGLQTTVKEVLWWSCLALSIGEYVPDFAVGELVRLAKDADEKTSVCAAMALCKCGPMGSIAFSVLGRASHSEDDTIAALAAGAFLSQEMRSEAAIPSLIEALKIGDEHAKVYVLQVLQQWGAGAVKAIPAVSSVLQDVTLHTYIRGRAAVTLGSLTAGNKHSLPLLMAALRTKEWQLVKGAAEGLLVNGCFEEDAIETLGKLLTAEKEELRGTAAFALRDFGPRAGSAIPAMVARFGVEPSIDVCHAIVEAFGAIGVSAIAPLVNLIRTDDIRQLPLISASLRAIGEEAAAAVADFMLRQPDELVRSTAILMLRDMGKKAAPAVPALITLLDDAADNESAGYLVCAIGACGQAANMSAESLVRCVVKWNEDVVEATTNTLKMLGESARVALTTALRAATGEAKTRIEKALAALHPATKKDFGLLERLNRDDLLKLFVLVGGVFEKQGETGWRDIATIMGDKIHFTRAGGRTFGKTANSIAKGVSDLSDLLESPPVPLTTHTHHQKGNLTPNGKKWLQEIREYVKSKYGDDVLIEAS